MPEAADSEVLSVICLDVGQGDATLVIPPGGETAIVLDCRDAHVVNKHLLSFEIKRITAVVFSHLDFDHIAGGLELLQTWRDRVDTVYIDKDARDIGGSSDEAARAKALIDYATLPQPGEARVPWKFRGPRDETLIDQGATWRVSLVAPQHIVAVRAERDERTRSANEYSAVLRAERFVADKTCAVLVGADAPLVTWAAMTDKERCASAFRIPHHGGAIDDGPLPDGWSTAKLYDEVAAEHAIISVGSNNDHGHPSKRWVEPLADRPGCRVRCTQVTPRCQPGVNDKDDASTWREEVLSLRGRAEPAWRHLTRKTEKLRAGTSFREVPCAGTVTIGLHLDGRVEVRPRPDDHDKVVDKWSRPWCRQGFPAEEGDEDEEDDTSDVLLDILSSG